MYEQRDWLLMFILCECGTEEQTEDQNMLFCPIQKPSTRNLTPWMATVFTGSDTLVSHLMQKKKKTTFAHKNIRKSSGSTEYKMKSKKIEKITDGIVGKFHINEHFFINFIRVNYS